MEEKDRPVRLYERDDRYELWFMDKFICPGKQEDDGKVNVDLCNLAMDLMHADTEKELHVFIWSRGGSETVLSTILQLMSRFKKTVAVNLGVADSCGWTLFFSCDERYAAKHSEFMYHDVSISFNNGQFKDLDCYMKLARKAHDLMCSGDVTKFLTDEEKKTAESGEVWLIGDDLIKRGACKDFSLYK